MDPMRIIRAIGTVVQTMGEALILSAWGFLALGLAMTGVGLIQQILITFLGLVPFLLLQPFCGLTFEPPKQTFRAHIEQFFARHKSTSSTQGVGISFTSPVYSIADIKGFSKEKSLYRFLDHHQRTPAMSSSSYPPPNFVQ
ncbi:hypothetical protein F5X99DRAFT_411668 [Biscogniauxia marginata]|nr:hypothetical protein F5X99DRAFT_411668 [Biscogniauxia marginata]